MDTPGKVDEHSEQLAFSILIPLVLWVVAWVGTVVLARFGPTNLWDQQDGVSWAAIAVNVVAGIGLIVAHTRYLRQVDELQRKIMVDAMALSLGGGLVAGCAYAAAEHAGLISQNADIGILIILMAMAYVAAVAVGSMRYR